MTAYSGTAITSFQEREPSKELQIEAEETKNRATGWAARLSAVLAAGCCVLPVAMMFVAGFVTRWVSSLGISDDAWSWIALGAVAAAAAAMFLRRLWNRRCETERQGKLVQHQP